MNNGWHFNNKERYEVILNQNSEHPFKAAQNAAAGMFEHWAGDMNLLNYVKNSRILKRANNVTATIFC